MKRVKLTFEYDGSNFSGWQKQPKERTVEGTIEAAMSQLYQQNIDLIGQGRTDSGVHAEAQVAHTDLPDRFSLNRLHLALAGLLPEDVALKRSEFVDDRFHARFHAKERTYEYRIVTRRSPMMRHYSWYCKYELSPEMLYQCAERILGEHDFVNFCIPHEGDSTTLCTITNSEWKMNGDLFIYRIRGDRFLRHMVRRLVGTMVLTARSKIEITDFVRLLEGVDTNKKGHSSPPQGLILKKVTY
jgi:tRNA pseudouridine38-40 synthase